MPSSRARRPGHPVAGSTTLAAALALLVVALVGVLPALAHEEEEAVRSTTPTDGQEVEEAPAVVIVEFTFTVAADFSLRVVGGNGTDHVASAELRDDGRTLVAQLDPLQRPGIYSAMYDVGYAQEQDHHRQQGEFSFIYAPPGSDPYGDTTLEDGPEPGEAPPPPPGAAASPGAEPADSEAGPTADNPRPGDLAEGFVAAAARDRSRPADTGWWSGLDPVQRTAATLVGGVVLLVVGAVERWTRPNR